METVFSITIIVIAVLTLLYIVWQFANNVYKRLLRFLIETRIVIIDPGDEEDADRFYKWLYSDKYRGKNKKGKRIAKNIAFICGCLAILCILLISICNHIIVNYSKGKVFSDIDSIKYNKVGLLLGTTPMDQGTVPRSARTQ